MRRPGHREALLAEEPRAAEGEEPLGRSEGGEHQDPSHVAGPVLLPVRDERHLFLLEIAAWRHTPAGHPHPQLGLVGAVLLVAHPGQHAPRAALAALEAHPHRCGLGLDHALLDVLREETPLSLDLPPVQALGPQADGLPGRRMPVEIGHHDVDRDRLTLLHEGPLGAQPHVAIGGVDQQIHLGGPGLAVDVLDGGLDAEVAGPRRIAALEVDAQAVHTRAVRPCLEGLDPLGLRRLRPGLPPRNEASRRQSPPSPGAGRCPGSRPPATRPRPRGGPRPRSRRRRRSRWREPAHEVRPLARGGLHLELRPPELLDLERVHVLAVASTRALGAEGEAGRAEVHGGRQCQSEIEAAQAAQLGRPLGHLVVAGVGQGPVRAPGPRPGVGRCRPEGRPRHWRSQPLTRTSSPGRYRRRSSKV